MRQTVLVLAATLFLSLGCEKVIPYDEQTYTPFLVVNGVIEADKPISIRVTESASILTDYGTEYEEIDDCQARLYEDGLLVESLASGAAGNYFFSHVAQAEKTYRIELDHERLPNARCETRVPGAINIDEAVGISGDDFQTNVTISWTDTDNTDFYQLLVYQVYDQSADTSLVGWSTSSPYFEIDPLGDGENYYWNDAVFLDELFANSTAELKIDANYYFNPDNPDEAQMITVLLGCSEDYYRYRSSLRLYQESDGGLFSQPVQIYSNVEGGLGVVGASNQSVKAVEF